MSKTTRGVFSFVNTTNTWPLTGTVFPATGSTGLPRPGRPVPLGLQDLDLVSSAATCPKAGSAGGARSGRAGGSLCSIVSGRMPVSTSITSGGTVLGVVKATKCVFFSQENCRPQ